MEKTEHCAVIGGAVHDEAQLLNDLFEGLSALQHRGQESVGISYFDQSIHAREVHVRISCSPPSSIVVHMV